MNQYLTGATIKRLREERKLTQSALAGLLGVSDKAVSKWETARGLPDISLIDPLDKALHISVNGLLTGDCVTNRNRSANLIHSELYVLSLIHIYADSVCGSCCRYSPLGMVFRIGFVADSCDKGIPH